MDPRHKHGRWTADTVETLRQLKHPLFKLTALADEMLPPDLAEKYRLTVYSKRPRWVNRSLARQLRAERALLARALNEMERRNAVK